MNLLITITPKGTRYYIESRRVSKEAYQDAQFWKSLSCLQTVKKGDITQHYSIAR